MTSVEEIVHHYQKSIEKASNDEKRLLHCLNKLCKLPVTVQHLQETGIGRTVNSLRKFDGDVGAKAKTLVTKWKEMVAAEESSENEAEESEKSDDDNINSDRDDEDVASPPESSPENRKTQIIEIKIKKEIDESQHLSSGTHNHQFNEEKLSRRKDVEPKENMSTYSENQIDSDLNDNGYKLKHRHHNSSKSSSHSKSHTPSNTKSSNGHQSSSSSHSKDKPRDGEKHSHSSHKHEKSTPHGSSSSSSSKRNREDSLSDKLSDIEENKLLIDDEKSKSSKKSKSEHKSSSNHHHHHSSSKHREHSKSKEHGSGSSHHKSKHEKSRKDNDDEHFKEKGNTVLHQNGENIITKHSREVSPQQNDAKQSRSEKSGKEKRTKSADAESKNNDSNKTAKKRVHESDDEKDGDGIDQSTGASFAEALGMLEPVSSKKTPKKKTQSPTQTKSDKFQSSVPTSSLSSSTNSKSIKSSSSKPSSSKSLTPLLSTPSSSSTTPSLLTSSVKLKPLDAELSFDFVPTISNNYKPMPLNPIVMDCVFYNNKPQKKFMTEEEAFGASISSKTMRTKVYSGTKTFITVVPPLLELCIRVLQKNIDALEYTGGVPFDILKPVLDRASADQLFNFEHFNPYLIDDSDVLWQGHCNRRFKGKKRLEMESWRDMFIRCFEEQESKLSSITENIKKTQVQSVPLKQTKLAYIDSTAKAPRNIRNKQIQFGTDRKLITTPAARVASLSNVTSNIAQVGDVRLKVVAGTRDSAQVQGTSSKPRKAPLMAKAMQLMKGRFKR